MDSKLSKSLLTMASAVALASLSQGAGFQIMEQSVSGLGNAFSGAAGAEDVSVMFYNPAGLARLDGAQTQLDAHYLILEAYFKNNGSTTTTQAGTKVTTSGGNSGGGFQTPVPSTYLSLPLGSRFTAGLSVNCPFGLGTEYDDGWVGRYMALKSEIRTFDVSPALAVKLTDTLSFGAAADFYYIDANLTNDIDFNKDGTPLFDGHADLKADDTAFGYHLGFQWQATPRTRFGVAYRSQVTTHLSGNANFTLPEDYLTVLTGLGYGSTANYIRATYADQGGGAELDLPASASINVYHNLTDKLDIMADVTWTDWSVFHSLDMDFDIAPTSSQLENWQDTVRYSAGATYKWSDSLKIRGGVAFDPAAVRGPEYRTPRIPDAKRFWISTGLNWQINQNSFLDLAYVHIFVDDPEIDNSIHTAGQHLKGTIEAYMDIISVSYTYRF